MNTQEAFNKIYAYYVFDKNPPGWDGNRCTYRGPSGEKCAVGVLMSDEDYEALEEEHLRRKAQPMYSSAYSLLTKNVVAITRALSLPSLEGYSLGFLKAMQEVHDEACDKTDFLKHFKLGMEKLADLNNLTIPVE